MNMKKRPARLGFAAALFALLLAPLAFSAQSALAQVSLPAVIYGVDQEAGTTITAHIDGEVCDSTDVNDAGEWLININDGDCNGAAGPGATVGFMIGDDAAAETVTWESGHQQVSLTVAPPEPEPEPTPDDGMDDGMDDGIDDGMDDGMDDGDDGMDDGADDGMTAPATPDDKGDTGNAGFATGSGSTSPLLALALGVLALAGVAGARTVTGRVS